MWQFGNWLTDDVLQSETPTLKPHNLLITWSTQGRMTSWKIYICTFTRLVGTRLGMVLTSGRSFSNEALQLSPASSLREECLNTEFFLVCIQSECWKIQTRKNSISGHFSRCACLILRASDGETSLCSYIALIRRFFKFNDHNAFITASFILTLYGKWIPKT